MQKQDSYLAVTHDIHVSVTPIFLEDESKPDEHLYVWGYKVRIENKSEMTVTLRARFWEIIDALGQKQNVHGDGVVGETPIIEPGTFFEYTSGTPLPTPSGIMQGKYYVETETMQELEIDIPSFSLDSPYSRQVTH